VPRELFDEEDGRGPAAESDDSLGGNLAEGGARGAPFRF
jgi:hypothetical protein